MQRLKVDDVKKVRRESHEQAVYTHELEQVGDSDDDDDASNTPVEWAKIKTKGEKLFSKGDVVRFDLDESQSSLDEHEE